MSQTTPTGEAAPRMNTAALPRVTSGAPGRVELVRPMTGRNLRPGDLHAEATVACAMPQGAAR